MLNVLTLVALRGDSGATPLEAVAESSVWAGFFDDDIRCSSSSATTTYSPSSTTFGRVERLVRDFDINSAEDLNDLFMYSPELAEDLLRSRFDVLAAGERVQAVADLLRVVYTSTKPIRVTPMSELSAADLRNNHVIYVGYISALDTLNEFVFAASGLSVGETYDELRVEATGDVFTRAAPACRATINATTATMDSCRRSLDRLAISSDRCRDA